MSDWFDLIDCDGYQDEAPEACITPNQPDLNALIISEENPSQIKSLKRKTIKQYHNHTAHCHLAARPATMTIKHKPKPLTRGVMKARKHEKNRKRSELIDASSIAQSELRRN